MRASYDMAFEDLYQQICEYSPQAALKLEPISIAYGAQAAYYAAFIIGYLHAKVEILGYKAIRDLTPAQLEEFTFFEYVKMEPQAVALFDDMLATFQKEQQMVR
ncbi:MAG: hypothetical protein ABI700_04305 [Chloroflexota bacterium]